MKKSSPREVFYVLAHGTVRTTETLTHRQRFGIPIVYLGTQGKHTVAGPTMVLIAYLMQIHGSILMNKLFSILQQYGEKYSTDFVPEETSSLEKDIQYLFHVNQEERKTSPQNMLRAYTGNDTVLNIPLGLNRPKETQFLDYVLSDNNKFSLTKDIITSSPLQYAMVRYQEKYFSLVNPFGILKFQEKQKTFYLDHPLPFPHRYPISDILKYIHEKSKYPIVFMIHCKSPLMKIDFEKYPLEKYHTKSLVQMMQALTLSPPPKTPPSPPPRTPPSPPPRTPPSPPPKTPPSPPPKTPPRTPPITNCFDKNVLVIDEPVTSTLLNKHHSRIISMLKSCFPLTKKDVTIKNYFHSPLQRIVCLYKWKKATMEKEMIAVCFLQKLDTDQCFIHSVCVQKKSQGKRCCDRLISYVVETYGKVYDLSLYVRVDKYKTDGLPANKPAIQCYRKSGFMFVEEPCSIQKDGLNCRMVRKKH